MGEVRPVGRAPALTFYRSRSELIRMDDPDTDERDIDEEAREIVEESLELGDHGPVESVDGECSRCNRDATWQDYVEGDLYCEEHATEHFEERHS